MNEGTTPGGWPFLIARGRRRGYSVLLAPQFLVAEQDHGFLEDTVGPVRGGEPCRTATVTTPRGRRVGVVWSDYPAVAGAPGVDLRDEHSRPLRLLGGFLCPDAQVDLPSPDDLADARAATLDTYGRFLADEEGFTVEASVPFRLRSRLTPLSTSRTSTPPPSRTPRVRRRMDVPMAVMGLVFAALVVVAVILVGSSGGGGAPPPVCATTTHATPQAQVTGVPTPTPVRC